MTYLGDVSHPETPIGGGASRVQVAEVVTVNADDGTIDASPLNGRATKAHVRYPTWWLPVIGDRCLIADRDGDPRQPICLGFLGPADGSTTGPQLQGTIGAASLPKASATALGITKLSTAPASPSNPIAVGDNDPRNTNARPPSGAAGGDLAGTYANPTVAKLSATATRFGTGGELRSGVADNAVISENYDSVADRLIDTSKPTWRVILGNSADQLLVQRAPATAGSPVFATQASIVAAGDLSLDLADAGSMIKFGSAGDAVIYRSAPAVVKTDGAFASGPITAASTSTSSSSSAGVRADADGRLSLVRAGNVFFMSDPTKAMPSLIIGSTGTMNWGDGTVATDTTLYRVGPAVLASDGQLLLRPAAVGNVAYSARLGADSQNRYQVLADGTISWGAGGSTAPDSSLYRIPTTVSGYTAGMLKVETTVAGDAGVSVQNKSSTGYSGHAFPTHDAGVIGFFGMASSGVAGGPYMRINPGASPLRLYYNGTLRFELDANGIGAFGVTPVARPAAYTQTYATATRTHSNPTAAAVSTTGATSTTPFGYTTAAQANAIVTAINALITDVANVKQVLNSVIDDNQAYGWLQ